MSFINNFKTAFKISNEFAKYIVGRDSKVFTEGVFKQIMSNEKYIIFHGKEFERLYKAVCAMRLLKDKNFIKDVECTFEFNKKNPSESFYIVVVEF